MIIVVHDRVIHIASAGSRKATSWPEQQLNLSDLYNRLQTPVRGTEGLSEYLRLPKSKQDELKDVGGFVAGSLRDNRRKAGNVIGRDVITLDLDSIPAGETDNILCRIDALGCGYALYSTRKHSPGSPRLRVLVPTDRTLSADEYEPVARKLAELIGIQFCDPSTFEASRLMYWPSCSADSQYIFRCADKPLLSAEGMLGLYPNWRDVMSWPQVPGIQNTPKNLAAKQEDPTAKQGVVGAFCRTYDIYSVIEKFIPGAYEPTDGMPDRYTFLGGSTSGGAVIYSNGLFLYSHHATDPAGGKLCNAFDLVRLHRFGELDNDAKPDTPINKLPSFSEMGRLAVADPNVSALLNQERFEKATADFEGVTSESDTAAANWMQHLQTSGTTGAPEKTADNMLIVLENDPNLKGRIGLDEFANKGIALGGLPWDLKRPERRVWCDSDDAGIRWYLEKVYGLTGKEKVYDALSLCGRKHSFDDVKNYLRVLEWDGIPRLDRLLIDYLGAPDTEYVRAVSRKAFTAAVARVMTPGVKFDTMTILTGPQGIGKSTLLSKMGKQWFTDGIKTFEGKEACEIIQGTWIVELGELEAFNRSEVERIKQFLSQTIDRYRAAYGRNVQDCPRRCVFFGTSNKGEFLRDKTGNRRFWPIDLLQVSPVKNVFTELDDEVDQLWAEAVMRWQLGEPLYLTGAVAKIALEEQESHRECSAREGIVLEFINKEVPDDWLKWSLDKRRLFWSGNVPTEGMRLVQRDRVCAYEVWCEAFGGDAKNMKYSDTSEINSCINLDANWERQNKPIRFGYAGIQKGFKRL